MGCAHEHGHVDVRLQVENGRSAVHITDNGPGIHPALRPHLFQRFKSYPLTSGLGLGLSYAKAIAESHGGTIEEIGQPQQGAHFVVTLPLVRENTNDHVR
jgi:signal transduction histidine kinase